ncbi:MAG: hypothetical protein AAB691_00435 [Patescibacteria group bacterium]
MPTKEVVAEYRALLRQEKRNHDDLERIAQAEQIIVWRMDSDLRGWDNLPPQLNGNSHSRSFGDILTCRIRQFLSRKTPAT